jgi:predicted RNA methylase
MNADTALVRKDSIEELCGHRARALDLYAQAFDLIEQARNAHARAATGKSHIASFPVQELRWFDDRSRASFIKQIRADLDRDVWQGLILNTPIAGLMDAEARENFERSVRDDPPEVTAETVYATMSNLIGDAELIFRRGLVNVFSRLQRRYRSHDGFKIGDRLILTSAMRVYDMFVSLNRDDQLIDLDRVMHVLDHQAAPHHTAGLVGAIREATHERPTRWQAETAYFHAKWHRNGNLHLRFKRADLVREANRLIAEHFGQTIGAAPDVATRRREPPEPDAEAFFPTPGELVEQMIAKANLSPGLTVLEPSAGDGAIALPAAAVTGGHVVCFEVCPSRTAGLRAALGGSGRVINDDFLRYQAGEHRYDRVLMNPPFTRGADALHVLHALDFLAPGGRLVAIVSGAIHGPADGMRPHAELRRAIERRGGQVIRLPAGSFKNAGTSVDTAMVIIDAA